MTYAKMMMKMERVRPDFTHQIDLISNICGTAACPLTLQKLAAPVHSEVIRFVRSYLCLTIATEDLSRVPLELFLSTTSRAWSFTHPKHAKGDFQLYAVENKSLFEFSEYYRLFKAEY